jgi:hypothetical protein
VSAAEVADRLRVALDALAVDSLPHDPRALTVTATPNPTAFLVTDPAGATYRVTVDRWRGAWT